MDLTKKSISFEKKHGSDTFVKIILNILTRRLIAKGVISAGELQREFLKEIDKFEQEKGYKLSDGYFNPKPAGLKRPKISKNED